MRVGFIVDDLVEDEELRVPLDRIGEAGHEVVIIGLERGKKIKGKRKATFTADTGIGEVDSRDFDALVIPGGYSPDKLRTHDGMVQLVREIYEAGKPLAAVCHGPWMLAEAEVADGVRMTSWPSIKTDLIHAGADWVDAEVVEDENVITSRKPADLGAFCDAILRQLENAASARAQPEAMYEEREEAGAEEAFHGGEGEGSPATHDLGGLQQRDRYGGRDSAARFGRGSRRAMRGRSMARPDMESAAPRFATDELRRGPTSEERITKADVDERRRRLQAAQPDRAPDASKELSPDDLE